MNEDKSISEQELDRVAGGMGRDGFEEVWADFERTHCSRCLSLPCLKDAGTRHTLKKVAAASWKPGQPIKCPGYDGRDR